MIRHSLPMVFLPGGGLLYEKTSHTTGLESTSWSSTTATYGQVCHSQRRHMVFAPSDRFEASADETVKIHPDSSKEQSNRDNRPIKPIQHPVGVKALLPLYVPSLDETYLFTASGDIIRSWDTSDLNDKIEQRNEMDGHWHDVTLLKAWFTSPDLYIMSASLDGTIRRWKVKGEGRFQNARKKKINE